MTTVCTTMAVYEKAVKDLLAAYFAQFAPDRIRTTAATLNRSTFGLRDYASTAQAYTMAKIAAAIDPRSLYYCPPLDRSTLVRLPYLEPDAAEPVVWLMGLQIVPRDTRWDETLFDRFGTERAEAKRRFGVLISAALQYFAALKHIHKELKHLTLEWDAPEAVLWLRDTRWPEHEILGQAIGVEISRGALQDLSAWSAM